MYTKIMKQEKCVPFEILKLYMNNPKFRKIIEEIPESDNPLVAVSYGDAIKTLRKHNGVANDIFNESAKATTLMALAGWRKSKQVYKFDPEFWELLKEQKTDMDIPVDILYQMPFKTIWLEPLNAFVFFDYSCYDDSIELKAIGFDSRGVLTDHGILKLLPNHTITECCEKMIEEILKSTAPDIFKKQFGINMNLSKEFAKYEVDYMNPVLQALLYICSQNGDVEENPEQKKIYKKPKNPSKPKDQFKEVRQWDVGQVVVRNLKKSYEHSLSTYQRENSSSGWTQRPHMRRAHWHSFWTGKKDNRKLIVKWIAPTFVNADKGEANPTVNVIKQERKI